MKTCIRCDISKAESEFFNDVATSDGKCPSCKECVYNRRKYPKVKPKAEEGYKKCNGCDEVKPYEAFWADKANKTDKRYSHCKACKTKSIYAWRENNRERYNKSMRDYMKSIPSEKRYGSEIKRRYGCTLEQYNEMLSAQGGACAVCKKLHNPAQKKGRLFVDHCHKTTKVRALLCGACNSMIGYANDDTRILAEAIAYIVRHR